MNRYITAVLFFIVILLGCFVFFVQPHLRSSREERMRGNFLLSIDPAKVRSIHIRNVDGVIQMHRRGTEWEVSSKIKDHASPEVIAQILESAKDIRVFDKISENEFKSKLKIKDFGLKWPKQQISLIGEKEPEVWFGNDAAVHGRVYACKQNSQAVYVVSNRLQMLISRPFNAFRDRQLTQLTPDQVRNIILKREGRELELGQVDHQWKILRPLEAQADPKKLDNFLETLLSAPILEFVGDESGDLSRFGIDDKSPSIIFQSDTEETPVVLKIGAPNKEGYYVQCIERKSVFLLPASVIKLLLEINFEDLRERNLLHVNVDLLDRIIIRSRDDSLVLDRKEGEWKGQQGNLEFPVKDEKVQQFLSAFFQQNVKNFLSVPENLMASYGLNPPEASVEFYSLFSENTPEAPAGLHKIASLTFSSPSKGVAFARSADSSEIFQVDPSITELVSSESSHWK